MAIKAFPTSQGYAGKVTGGRNGQIVFFTNLNDSGSGSFRDTVLIEGEKIVVPKVSGNIDLSIEVVIRALRSNMTILGGLAPFGGICLKGEKLRYDITDNHILRYIRSRRGDNDGEPINEDDSFEAKTGVTNMIIDHCSFSWGADETCTFYNAENITIQNSIISEGLNVSAKPQIGGNAFGGIIGGDNISFIQNFLAHLWLRAPSIADGSRIDLINNYTYNWGFRPANGGQLAQSNMYYNYYKEGPATIIGGSTVRNQICQPNAPNYGMWYLEGNELEGNAAITADNWLGMYFQSSSNQTADRITYNNGTPFSIPSGTYDPFLSISQVKSLLGSFGASVVRDSIDARLALEALNGTATFNGSVTGLPGIIDSPNDVGGYPDLTAIGEDYLTGVSPHFLPSWFLGKYGMSDAYNYTLAGDPIARPERFIRFSGTGQGVQLSQFGGSVDYENDLIYNVYEVLEWHRTGEINLLETIVYELTVTSIGGGTTNITTGNFAPSSSILLSASPNSGKRFVRWERLIGDTWILISSSNPFNLLMPSSDASVRAVFEDAPTNSGKKFFARKKRIL